MAKKKNKIKKRIWQMSFLLLLLGGLMWLFIPSPIAVRVDTVHVGSFSAVLEAEGKTQARSRMVIWAPVAGVLQRMPVAVGSPVGVEQVVARLVPDVAAFQDAKTLQFLKARAASALAAKSHILALREQTAAGMSQARQNLRDADRLVSPGIEKALQRERAQIALKLIFKELETMDAVLRSTTFDFAAAEAALGKIKGIAPPEWVFRAPMSGVVLSEAESGRPVGLGTSVIEIGNPSDLEVIVETPVSQALQVSAGQRAQLKPAGLDAIAGRVRRVDVIPSATDPAQTKTRIAIEFSAPPAELKTLSNNQRVSARITLATIDNVLKISNRALIREGAQTAVFVIENGRAHKRRVTYSARDADFVVIEQGLKAGDQLIVNPRVNIKEGVKVQAQ